MCLPTLSRWCLYKFVKLTNRGFTKLIPKQNLGFRFFGFSQPRAETLTQCVLNLLFGVPPWIMQTKPHKPPERATTQTPFFLLLCLGWVTVPPLLSIPQMPLSSLLCRNTARSVSQGLPVIHFVVLQSVVGTYSFSLPVFMWEMKWEAWLNAVIPYELLLLCRKCQIAGKLTKPPKKRD